MTFFLGIWNNYDENHEDRIACFYPNSSRNDYRYYDEDADIDEYEEEGFESTEFDSAENNYGQNQRELYVLQSIVKYLLPLVGLGVQKIVISSCRSLTSNLVRYSILNMSRCFVNHSKYHFIGRLLHFFYFYDSFFFFNICT